MSEDFSKGKRGAVINPDPNKVRITIRLDADIIEHFKKIVHKSGGGTHPIGVHQHRAKSFTPWLSLTLTGYSGSEQACRLE